MDQKRASDLTRFGEPVLPGMSLGRIFVIRGHTKQILSVFYSKYKINYFMW